MTVLNNAARAKAHAASATLPEVRCVHTERAERYSMLLGNAERIVHAGD